MVSVALFVNFVGLANVYSVGCGDSKVAVSKDIYKLFEETLSAKEKAENMLKLYTNSVCK